MEASERRWLYVLIGVFLLFNAITLSPLVPWQKWLLWSKPEPARQFTIQYENYQIHLPPGGIEAKVGEYVEFITTSSDVTYGLGVFRADSTLVFQMQVVPGHENHMIWKFDQAGTYDIRSSEYSGPRHSEMHVPGAIHVTE